MSHKKIFNIIDNLRSRLKYICELIISDDNFIMTNPDWPIIKVNYVEGSYNTKGYNVWVNKDGVEERGSGRTIQRAYDMATKRRYDVIKSQLVKKTLQV
jgi:hypothetical protein